MLYNPLYMDTQDVKQLKKSVNYRFGAATIEALAGLVERWSCKPTAAVERAILEASAAVVSEAPSRTGFEVQGEAGTIMRWWMRQDGMSEQEVIEAALTVYDDFRQNGTSSAVPSTSADGVASIAARAAAAAKAAREQNDLSTASGVPLRRESASVRAAREKREREDRARDLDSSDDESIDRSDEYVSN